MISPLLEADDITAVVDQVATAMLDWSVTAFPGSGAQSGPPAWTGSVEILGAWHGQVDVIASDRFVRHAASRMMRIDSADVTEVDARDALSELTNIIGGNLKGLVSASVGTRCSLGLPQVTRGRNPAAQSTREILVPLVLGFEPITIRITEFDRGSGSQGAP
jgi:CheY-specific phosphatase CheX